MAGRWFARIDLRWRLLIGVALFALPILGVQAWTAAEERSRAIEDARQQARSIALLAEANYAQVMLAGEAALSTLTDSPSIQSGRGPECDGVLGLFGNSHPAFSAFSVADVDGAITCSGQADLVGLSVADRPYFHSALRAGQIVSSGFLISRPSGIPIIVLAAPFGDGSGDVISGVLILSLELDWVSDVLGRLDLPPGSTLTVTGASGDEIIRLGGEDADGTATVGAQQPLRRTAASGSLDGSVSVLIPRGEVIAAATTSMWRNLLTLAGAAGAFGVISFALVTTTVQHPLDRLVEFTRRLAAGDFGVRTETRAIDAPEVVHLADAMNTSAESLGEQERRLVEMATVDTLTGLPNRIGFVRLASGSLADASRQGGTAVVGVVGLRAFTAINATLGFEVGDEVLRAVGARIKATLPDGAVVARLNGDSFVFSLLGHDVDGERSVAELLHDVLASPLRVGGTLLRVRSYVGLSVSPEHGDDLDLLTRRAEVASRRARDGAQHWAQFDRQRDEPDNGQLPLLADLQGAIERSALEVHYQPKV
ncbi:MAG: diguanylate cyclase, partial [Dehalococcoidia bacterium]|nr:diguanylate cyclase [Dehalococcoidia bacterium]